MSQTRKILLGTLIALVIVLFISYSSLKGMYNNLIALDEGVKTAWSQVENQLQRRADLIPNYVEVVKGYAKQEKEVLISVTEARAKVAGAGTVPEKITANNQLSSALSRLLLVVERYPDLKSNQNFIRLQDELAGTENRIAVERRRYNEAVRIYNVKRRSFPTNIFAKMWGFGKADLFEAPKEAKKVPQIKF
jgi:LemA protein